MKKNHDGKELERSNRADVTRPKLNIVRDPSKLPTETLMSGISPVRDYDQPPHHIHSHNSRRVNSKTQSKGEPRETNQIEGPMYFGSSYTHTPNANVRPYQPKPNNPRLPQPRAPINPADFAAQPMMHNRTIQGTILGSPPKRYADEMHVPYMPEDIPLGPDNLTKDINDTWMSCWDKEVSAIYYYNKLTGEATWINPLS